MPDQHLTIDRAEEVVTRGGSKGSEGGDGQPARAALGGWGRRRGRSGSALNGASREHATALGLSYRPDHGAAGHRGR